MGEKTLYYCAVYPIKPSQKTPYFTESLVLILTFTVDILYFVSDNV